MRQNSNYHDEGDEISKRHGDSVFIACVGFIIFAAALAAAALFSLVSHVCLERAW